MLAISSWLFIGAVLSQVLAKAQPNGCNTNAECLRRGLPLRKPRAIARKSKLISRATFTYAYTGDFQFFVPITSGPHTITAGGAAGAPGYTVAGGNGITATATFNLDAGANYTVIVGGSGQSAFAEGAGGGGGSWVYLTRNAVQPIIVAAGGGGGSASPYQGQSQAGSPGRAAVSGDTGIGGQGGPILLDSDVSQQRGGGGGGAGWTSSGGDGAAYGSSNLAYGGKGGQNRNGSPPWAGGRPSLNTGSAGGFGGGGGGATAAGAGGGGYSGGNGGAGRGNSNGNPGQGGTSYVDASRIVGTATYVANVAGNGQVTIVM